MPFSAFVEPHAFSPLRRSSFRLRQGFGGSARAMRRRAATKVDKGVITSVCGAGVKKPG